MIWATIGIANQQQRGEQAMSPREILLIYDEECPVCDAYCRMVRIRESVGMLRLVNARDVSAVMDEITSKGLDIDQGMVLKVENVLYYGSDAIHALSLMSSPSGVFNRVNYWIFRSERLSRFGYGSVPALPNTGSFLEKCAGLQSDMPVFGVRLLDKKIWAVLIHHQIVLVGRNPHRKAREDLIAGVGDKRLQGFSLQSFEELLK